MLNAGGYSERYPSAADIIVPLYWRVIYCSRSHPVVQRMTRCRIPRVVAVSLLIVITVMLMVLLLAYLGTSLNELARTPPQYRPHGDTVATY